MMKRSSAIIIVLVLCFMEAPAFPLSYEIDVGQDGVFESGQIINVSPQSTATIDLYIAGYSCPPDDKLFAVCAYILVDESIAVINYSCRPFYPTFDQSLSACTSFQPNIYTLTACNFSFVQVSDGRQKFGTLAMEFIENDEYFDLVVATDLTAYGYPGYSDGFIADCNLGSIFPTDAVVTMIRTANPPCYCDFSGDGRVGVADMVIMKQEFRRDDCDVNPCQADCNGDGSVNLTDLVILKSEFNRRDCPELP